MTSIISIQLFQPLWVYGIVCLTIILKVFKILSLLLVKERQEIEVRLV